jgi:hypothetical protein
MLHLHWLQLFSSLSKQHSIDFVDFAYLVNHKTGTTSSVVTLPQGLENSSNKGLKIFGCMKK